MHKFLATRLSTQLRMEQNSFSHVELIISIRKRQSKIITWLFKKLSVIRSILEFELDKNPYLAIHFHEFSVF